MSAIFSLSLGDISNAGIAVPKYCKSLTNLAVPLSFQVYFDIVRPCILIAGFKQSNSKSEDNLVFRNTHCKIAQVHADYLRNYLLCRNVFLVPSKVVGGSELGP